LALVASILRLSRRSVLCAGLVCAAGFLAGCPQPIVRDRPYAAPTAEELTQAIKKSRAGLFALRARAKADVLSSEGRVKVDNSLVLARPQRLRLAAENSLTGPLVTLATDGTSFQLLDVRQNRYQAGAVSPCNMARILGVALHPSQVLDVLLGSVPLLPDATSAQVSWDGRDGGREVLTLKNDRGLSEVVYLQAAAGSFDVREAEGRDEKGAPVWRLRHENFVAEKLGDGPSAATVRMPSVTYIEDPPHKSDVRLRWRERELNPEIEPGVFELAAPSGVPVEPDVCAGQPPAAAPPAAPAASPAGGSATP
jgi:hypothetical protein